jgi:hypothetical protein
MRQILSSDDIIETLVTLHCGQDSSLRDKHIFRESLRNLVRLAKAEETGTLLMQPYQHLPTHDTNVLH